MRLLVTADLHVNHPRSGPPAGELIEQINRAGGDALLVAGDTATAEGDTLERALDLFRFRGPRLFVAGNHELWTRGGDTAALFRQELPQRVRSAGWHWLEDDPFDCGDGIAIVGSIGWYDYSFAVEGLQIPRRFYEAKVSPGVAARLSEYSHLMRGDEPEESKEIVARWNDGKFVRLGMSDEVFVDSLIDSLARQLDRLRLMRTIVAAVHHVPFAQLLPPRHGAQWDFARAYLGSGRIGELLARHPNVRHVFCGHSHRPAEATVGQITAVNIGCGYRFKTFLALDIE